MRTNPVDMGPAWYDSAAIQGIVKVVMRDEAIDGILILMMFASANREAVANLSAALGQGRGRKPVISCLIAPPGIWDQQVTALEESGALVNLPAPERAAYAMSRLWERQRMNETEWSRR
jgi:acyl-CoA synthetase (NDP forming)